MIDDIIDLSEDKSELIEINKQKISNKINSIWNSDED